jgi:DNA-binding transcriptional ArsR family regulator
MKEGPDIARVAALIGNPANANMLMALMAGSALTATELAQEAGLMLSTASGHLARLGKAGLVATTRQGRHRYFRLADRDVALALEGLMPVAARAGLMRVRTGTRDPELRRARSCYDHLAGHLAVMIFDRAIERRLLVRDGEDLRLTAPGLPLLSRLERTQVSHRGSAGRRHPGSNRGQRLGGAGSQITDRTVFACRRAQVAGLVVTLAAGVSRRPCGRGRPAARDVFCHGTN